jgi:hypothetical protein
MVPASACSRPRDEVEQRRLADARLAEDRDQFAARDVEGNAGEHGARPRTGKVLVTFARRIKAGRTRGVAGGTKHR